ncbi:hypothetical protein Aperf_G00000043010 [Anoplocephala perfoliata]
MDLCTGGTLDRMLREDKLFPENAIIEIGRQLVIGLQFIHSSGVIFADWFPSRIFLDGCGNIKYFDFSYARLENERSSDIISNSSTTDFSFDGLSQSALSYTAPEIISGASASKASDVWGLGCLLFRMFFGVTPFSSQVDSHLIKMISSHEVEMPIQCTRQPSSELWSLLCAMLMKDPGKRILLQNVANHQFWNMNLHPETDNPNLSIKDIREPFNIPNDKILSPVTDVNKKVAALMQVNGKLQSTVESSSPTLKRSVSMGDSALASVALLHNKLPIKQVPATPKEVSREQINTTTTIAEAMSPIGNGFPVGDASFTLHAQVCPLPVRPEVYDPRATSNKTQISVTSNSNEESIDTSSHGASNTFTTPDSTKQAFFESNDSLLVPMSPLPTEERMTKSEYVFRNSDASHRFGSTRIPQTSSAEASSPLVSPQTRARIALIYPWGDDAATLSQDVTLLAGLTSSNSNKIFESDELEEFNGNSSTGEKDTILPESRPKYVSQPLDDYTKLLQNPPKADLQLPPGLPVLTLSSIQSLKIEEIDNYSSQLLSQMMDPATIQDPKNRPSSFFSYVAWFLAAITMEWRKEGTPEAQKDDVMMNKISRIKSYLSAAVSLLKLDATSAIMKTRLFRIIGLLIHFSSIMIQHDTENPDGDQIIHTLISEIAPDLPTLMTTVVDILREPAFKGAFPLKQSGITTLGEIIICQLCIYSRVLQNPMVFNSLSPRGFEVSKEQWQSAILRIIRSLPKTNSRTGNNQYSPRNTSSPTLSKGLERGNSVTKSSFPPANEDTIRVAAARTLNEVIVVVLGHKLMRNLQRLDMQKLDRAQSGFQVVILLSSSLSSFFDCLLTPETVSRVWADGIISSSGASGGNSIVETRALRPAVQTKNSLVQQVGHASCSALAGLIRLRPSLFMCGLIDRNGSVAFMHKLNPATSAKEGQTTAFMACLLSATATGLLLPLAFHKSLGASLLRAGMKSGTPAACRRFLNNSRFMASIMRQLESPHVMLRAKTYLLVAAALDSSSTCGETLIAACDARLPSCLERDLRITNQHYIPHSAYNDDGVLIVDEGGTGSNNFPGINSSMPSGLQYLGICVKHLSDLLVHSLIPNICSQVALAIGACGSSTGGRSNTTVAGPAKPSSKMTMSTYQDRTQRNVSSAGAANKLSRLSGSSSTLGISLKTCLPAFSCLPGILASSASIRNYLLLPPKQSNPAFGDDGFCLIQFLAKIIDHWASSMGIHHSGSAESHLLRLTLAIAEDISRQLEVVESRREDLIKALLPALARLAVAPTSDSITRTVCVKIILDMRKVWCGGCGDTDSITSSNISLNYPESSSLALTRSPLSSDRLNTKPSSSSSSNAAPLKRTASGVSRTPSLRSGYGGENKRPSSATGSSASSLISTRSLTSRVSSYRPNSFYGRSSSGISSLKGYKYTSNLTNNFKGPTPDVLLAVVDIVNNLLIPYAPPLLDLRDASPAPFFLGLLLDCLKSFSSPSEPFSSSLSPFSFFSAWRFAKIPQLLLCFLANCNCESHRFSTHTLLALNVLSILASQWPQESGLIQLILQPPAHNNLNILVVVYNVVLDVGGALIRRERCGSTANTSTPRHTPNSSRGIPSLFRVSLETVGVRHLFVSLELLNALLDLVTDVVRYALHCRQGKSTNDFTQPRKGSHQYIFTNLPNEFEDICSVAEGLLSSSRPPKHLPGILASILEVSFDAAGPLFVKKTREMGCEAEGSSLAANLVTLALSALASLASLYSGEYCRTALSAAGLRGFTMALQRNDTRTNTRLLLRILRRLCESDDVCLRRLTGPAAKPLYSVISKLRCVESTFRTAQTTPQHPAHLASRKNRLTIHQIYLSAAFMHIGSAVCTGAEGGGRSFERHQCSLLSLHSTCRLASFHGTLCTLDNIRAPSLHMPLAAFKCLFCAVRKLCNFLAVQCCRNCKYSHLIPPLPAFLS